MGIELRYTCLNCKPSQSTRLPPGVSGTSRTSGNLASDRPDWVDWRLYGLAKRTFRRPLCGIWNPATALNLVGLALVSGYIVS